MSHAPYLADLGGGMVGVVWFAGSREWAKDVQLHLAILNTATGEWGPIMGLVSDVGFSLGNSVLQRDSSGLSHLFYVRTRGYWHEGVVVHMTWNDLEKGFLDKTEMPLARGWLIRGRPILRGSKFYLPVYHETELVSAVWEQELTENTGKLHETIGGEGGLIHPTLVDVAENEFRCFMRNPRAPHRIHFAYSMDRGATWSRPFPTPLPNPNSGIDVVRLSKRRLLCAYNDSENHRYPLSLAVSDSEGANWEKLGDLERAEGEFSYPSLLAMGEKVFLAYTYKREAIRVVTLDHGFLNE